MDVSYAPSLTYCNDVNHHYGHPETPKYSFPNLVSFLWVRTCIILAILSPSYKLEQVSHTLPILGFRGCGVFA